MELDGRLKQLETVLLLSKPLQTNLRIIEYEARIRGIDRSTLDGCVAQYKAGPKMVSATVKNIAETLLQYQCRENDPGRFAIDGIGALDNRVKAMYTSVNNRYRHEQQAFLATHPQLRLPRRSALAPYQPKKTFFQKVRGFFGSVFSYA